MSEDASSMKEFTKIATDYDKGRSGEDVLFWAGETKELASLDEDSILLDLGCGTGLYTVGLREHTSATTCGLDPSVGMLSQAKEKTNAIHWFNAVGERLPIRSGVFDCIFSSQVWHHITEKQDTADECGRTLNTGGTVVIRTISHEQLRRKVVFQFFPEIMENQLRVYPTNEEFSRYFSNAGFTSTDFLAYELERYQEASLLIEVAQKKLWSMFRPISQLGLERGVDKLRSHETNHPGKPLRNDETITLVVVKKGE
jgi:ubiquinone/menaquinone biosynthesis C-methylase UbiE